MIVSKISRINSALALVLMYIEILIVYFSFSIYYVVHRNRITHRHMCLCGIDDIKYQATTSFPAQLFILS